MKHLRKSLRILVLGSILLTLLGCTLIPQQPVETQPTEIAQDVIRTFSALVTETAQRITPSLTFTNTPIPPTPTRTATITQTSTARPTLTPLPPRTSCQLISQTPRGRTVMGPRWDFDAIWTIKNSGLFIWDPDEVVFRFIRGEPMQKRTDEVALPSDIEPQDTVDFRVDMVTPEQAGEYTSIWGLMDEGETLCIFAITVVVE